MDKLYKDIIITICNALPLDGMSKFSRTCKYIRGITKPLVAGRYQHLRNILARSNILVINYNDVVTQRYSDEELKTMSGYGPIMDKYSTGENISRRKFSNDAYYIVNKDKQPRIYQLPFDTRSPVPNNLYLKLGESICRVLDMVCFGVDLAETNQVVLYIMWFKGYISYELLTYIIENNMLRNNRDPKRLFINVTVDPSELEAYNKFISLLLYTDGWNSSDKVDWMRHFKGIVRRMRLWEL